MHNLHILVFREYTYLVSVCDIAVALKINFQVGLQQFAKCYPQGCLW